ncbi:MAG: PIN domain-containing protein [Xanthomonadales bacterium]|nr:PIN domain-containing protein [Xanthomonadales bacterium]
MSAEVFVDSNVLYYANTESNDPRHTLARQQVERLWDTPGRAAVSVQVLQELHVNLVRKAGLSPQQSAQRVGHYLVWRVIDNDRVLLTAAFEVQTRWQLSFWDSLIVAAAQRSGAAVLWSADMADGQQFGTVRIVNPLR